MENYQSVKNWKTLLKMKILHDFQKLFSKLEGKKNSVHGGGKRATAMVSKLGIKSKMVWQTNLQNAETLECNMVYVNSK
jgi:acetylglutamate kinase